MSAEDLKQWMTRTGKNEVDIAAALKMDPITVKRFLKGKSVHRNTRARLEEYVRTQEVTSPAKQAAG